MMRQAPNLLSIWEGKITISNKVGRVDKVLDRLRATKSQGRLSRHEGQVLVGLLRFAGGFFGGRQLRYVCNDLNALKRVRDLEGYCPVLRTGDGPWKDAAGSSRR